MAQTPQQVCYVCGKEAKSRCTACALVFYCGPDCQKGDWSRHKPLCKELKKRINLSRTLSVISVVDGQTQPFTVEFFENELEMDPLCSEIIEAIKKMYHGHYTKRRREELKLQKQMRQEIGIELNEGEKEEEEVDDQELIPPGTKMSVTLITPLQLQDNKMPKTVRELLAAHGHYQIQLFDANERPLEVAVLRSDWHKLLKSALASATPGEPIESAQDNKGQPGAAKTGGKKRRNRNKNKGQQQQQISDGQEHKAEKEADVQERVKVLEKENEELKKELAALREQLAQKDK